MPDFLFDFQRALVEWSVRKGRCAILADCGLGKTPMQLVWAENVVRHTNRPVLIAAPLAVSQQVVREAEKFGIGCTRSQTGAIPKGATIVVTNYERLHLFDSSQFAGMVCDESSILKNFDGSRKAVVTEFLRRLPHRLLCTATAAPNDYVELGTSSEALGELGHFDMLSRFFRNTQHTNNPNRLWDGAKWRFKGHAENHFWRWVCSWARAVRKPSDLGFDDAQMKLPPLDEREHIITAATKRDGLLFDLPATNLQEEREERRRTITERCERVAELVDHGSQALVWCHLNDEGDLLTKLIDGAVQVRGSDTEEAKEAALVDFAEGRQRVLVTKPRIGAWGLNFQSCSHVTFFPSHSYEQYYQGVRRCWRFGQDQPVRVDIVASEGEKGVLANLRRKAGQADTMFSNLVEHMNDAMKPTATQEKGSAVCLPQWM
ncbi:MAG: helicase [bacterium]|nr:helicase [bacterium]